MKLIKFITLSYDQVEAVLKEKLVGEGTDSHTIIAESVSRELCEVEGSTLIFKFVGSGEIIALTERVYKNKLNWLDRLKLKRDVTKKYENENTTSILLTINSTKEYIDITLYKEWWFNWALNLTM